MITTITPKQLLDYISCPMIYKFKYIDNLVFRSERELFQDALKSLIDKLYYSFLDGKAPTMAFTKYGWGESWSLETEKDKIIWMDSTNIRRKLMLKGLQYSLAIRKHLIEIKPKPISINDIYGIQFGKYRLETTMDYVFKIGDDFYLIDYVDNDCIPDEFTLKNHLPLTAKLAVYENVFNQRIKHIIYYSCKNKTAYFAERSQSDLDDLGKTVNIALVSINNNMFYKQYSDACKLCPYKTYCSR